MSQTLALSPRRMITPIAAFVVAVVLAATLALGFGIRTWTEHTARPSAPAGVGHKVQVHPAAPQELRRFGRHF